MSILKVSLCKGFPATFHFVVQPYRCGMEVEAEAPVEEFAPNTRQSCKVPGCVSSGRAKWQMLSKMVTNPGWVLNTDRLVFSCKDNGAVWS